MNKHVDLSTIIRAIDDKLTPLESDLIESTVDDFVGILLPEINVMGSLIQKYDKIKFAFLLRGLASEKNVEYWLNELHNYVNKSTQRALTVANTLRETLTAKTPKICVLYGEILRNHIKEQQRDFSADDIIVCHALENASDYDLEDFKVIMSYSNNSDKRIKIPKRMLSEFQRTFSWCVYSRLYYTDFPSWSNLSGYSDKQDDDIVESEYLVGSAAELLLSLLVELKQILKY